jgi:hypothetical protein
MTRRSHSTKNLLTSTALVLGLSISWSIPSLAFAAPPVLPPEPTAVAEPAPAPAPEPEPVVVVQPAPAPEPAPAPAPGWEQPQPAPAAQPVPPPPVYQPQPYAQPVPPPYKPYNRNRGLGLVISGFSIFGISYLITAASGTIAIDAGSPEIGRPLLIPGVGPFIAASRVPSATLGFGLGFTGVIQLAGLAMGTSGAVMLGNARRKAALSAAPGGLQLQF